MTLATIIRDRRRIKNYRVFKKQWTRDNFGTKNLKFNPAEHTRIGSKTVIELSDNFSAFIIARNIRKKSIGNRDSFSVS